MAERDQLVRPLGGHDAGDPRGADHVALLGIAGEDQVERLPRHHDRAARRGGARGDRLVADIDHVGAAISRTRCVSRALIPAASAFSRASSARVAAATSACRIRLSPTRMARMPAAREPRHIGRREDAALADEQPVGRHQRRQALGHGERRLEGPEVAVVDADERRGEPQRALELRLVVHLDEHVHAERERRLLERLRLVVGDRRHDDQDAVGAPGARLEDLVGLEHEILAERRQRAPRAPRSGIPARPGRRARRSAPRGRPRRPPHRRAPAPAGRNRRGSAPSTGSPS